METLLKTVTILRINLEFVIAEGIVLIHEAIIKVVSEAGVNSDLAFC